VKSLCRGVAPIADTLEHRAEKWIPVFGGKRCGNKELEHRA